MRLRTGADGRRSAWSGAVRQWLAAPLAMAGWVVVTYGFRFGTAVAQRTWDSVAASVVLLGLSAAVVVGAVRSHRRRPVAWLPPVVRVFTVLAAGWSVFRLVTTWTGTHATAFVAVHTVIAGVLLVLAVASWRSAQEAAQRVPSAGGVPASR